MATSDITEKEEAGEVQFKPADEVDPITGNTLFCIAYAVISVVGGCDACGTKKGWGVMLGLPNRSPFATLCADDARALTGILLNRFLEVQKGDVPTVIKADPFPRGGITILEGETE